MNWRQKVIILLALLILMFCGLEGALRFFDPWHVGAMLAARHIPAERDRHGDLRLLPGVTDMAGDWTLTIQEDGTRFVPDTNPHANCTIAFIGDSVTLGYGVSDAETWVNQIAQAFPQVHFINGGVHGYSSVEVRRAKARIAADGYIYLITHNDADINATINDWRLFKMPIFYIQHYVNFYRMMNGYAVYERDTERFQADVQALHQQGVLIVMYEDSLSSVVHEVVPDAPNLQWRWKPVSRLDGHANVAGNRQGAALMRPYVEQVIREACP